MHRIRSAAVLLVAIALLLAAGCLELAGQRITIRHDVQKDELHVLLHYDGVHDSGNNQYGNGAQQLAAAVQNGEFMLLDWPLHIQPATFKELADANDNDVPPAVRDFAAVVGRSMTVKTIGYHRDPDGRIGGSQLVTIKGAKAFIKSANDAVSAAILSVNDAADPQVARTWQLIRDAATNKHQWLSLEGSAIKVSVPVHPREWAVLKAKGAIEGIRGLTELLADSNPNREKDERNLLRVITALTSAPIEYGDADGLATLRIGNEKSSSTIRIELDKEYKPNLLDDVRNAAPIDADEAMAKLMIGEKVEKNGELVAEVMRWGPPEEKVRGLMRMVKADDANLAAKAAKRLETFAEEWNKSEGIPKAPAAMDDTEQYLAAWTKWYEAMLRFPVGAVEQELP